jgi:hypothetical protein
MAFIRLAKRGHLERGSAPASPSHHTNPVLFFCHLAPFTGCMAASAGHSSSSFRSQVMHPPSPVQGLRLKAAIGAV